MREISLWQGLFFPPDVFLFNLKPKSCLIKTSIVADLFGESFATSEILEQGCYCLPTRIMSSRMFQ